VWIVRYVVQNPFLSKMAFSKAFVSSSESADGPANVSLHGLVEEPPVFERVDCFYTDILSSF